MQDFICMADIVYYNVPKVPMLFNLLISVNLVSLHVQRVVLRLNAFLVLMVSS